MMENRIEGESVLPKYYFNVICCPKCKSDLAVKRDGKGLFCYSCESTYPVVEGIPVLLGGVEDEVSRIIKEHYDSQWRKNEKGILKEKVQAEDLSEIGQLYIKTNESRFVRLFKSVGGHDYFLDAGSGAQPRVEFGEEYSYHICVDFSIDGLIESKKLLGNRAICVCGSLLNIPLKDSICNGIIASHVIYHIGKELQGDAIKELSRVLHREGTLLVFYRNPTSFEQVVIKGFRRLMRKENINGKGGVKTIYVYAHPIKYMVNILSRESDIKKVDIRPLRMLTRASTQYHFRVKYLGKSFFKLIMLIENIFKKHPSFSSYVAYIAEK